MDIKWLPLTEYSNKYRVSISTLRRRIRMDRAEVSYLDGKYLLKDAPLSDHKSKKQRTQSRMDIVPPPPPPILLDFDLENDDLQVQQKPPAQPVSKPPTTKPVEATPAEKHNDMNMNSHNMYLNELKRAYSLILQEKEEHVLILKDEIADLQTLVKVLERDNDRLRIELKESKAAEKNDDEMTHKAFSPNLENLLDDQDWESDLDIE